MALGPRSATRARTLVRGAALLLAAGLGVVAGCPLHRGFSCGDGWWDPEYDEACDPRDVTKPYLDACRERGFAKDATCDPDTCTILASDIDCNECGDGVAAVDEQCDGQDLLGQTCNGTLACNDQCRLDWSGCEQECGDGVLLGDEECEAEVDPVFKNLACSDYESTAVGLDKPYAAGTIGACNEDTCTFGRNDCSFCGDGELDPEYTDIIAPQGTAEIPAEVCDTDQVAPGLLADHCEALCVNEPINGDVIVNCDFACSPDCSGIAPIEDIIPDPTALGCCVAKDSPCPKFDLEGVPNLPCCSWLENPDWMEDQKCVVEDTDAIPITYICP